MSYPQIIKSDNSSIIISEKDTLIHLTLNGVIKEYRIAENSINELIEFQNVINVFNQKLEFQSKDSTEITGEGLFNNYSTLIKEHKDGFLVTHTIEQNSSIIWFDTLLVDDRVWYFFDDSLFFQLKPYSQFYIAYKYFREFIGEKFDTTTEFYKSNKAIIHGVINYHKNTAYWNNYLGNFKGRIVTKLSIEDADAYIWDKMQKRFITFYEP